MQLCGVCLVGFTSTTLLDVVARVAGHPLLWPQEVTSAFFIYGVFVGASVATRRNDHLQLLGVDRGDERRDARRFFEVFNRAVVMAVGLFIVVYGWQNFLTGFGSFRMPSMLPIAYLYAPIPLCGALVALFSLEQIVNGLRHGFGPPAPAQSRLSRCRTAPFCSIMTVLFLALGYLGVPVAFSLMAGVIVGTMLTPITLQSIVGQMFNGVDSEALMAIPFFLLVGELMTSANVIMRIAELSQALVGHIRGGLAQVTTVFSMFFSGMSGSSSADVAVLSRTMARPMAREGYSPAFVAALIAAASTIANLVPPSIMAVVYGAVGNVSIAGLFLAGILPGLMIGLGLMLFCYFFGPVGFRRPRSSFGNLVAATRAAALPLLIPVILLGGIMTGWFTPTEAGVVAVAYILIVVIPLLNPAPYAVGLARLRAGRTDLLAAADHHRRRVRVRLAAGLSARPDRGRRLDRRRRRQRSARDHVPVWCGVHHRRRLHRADPGDHHLHAGGEPAHRPGFDQRRAYGHCADHHAGVRPDHAALRTVAADGVEVRRRPLLPSAEGVAADLRDLLRDDRVRDLFPGSRAVAAEDAVP